MQFLAVLRHFEGFLEKSEESRPPLKLKKMGVYFLHFFHLDRENNFKIFGGISHLKSAPLPLSMLKKAPRWLWRLPPFLFLQTYSALAYTALCTYAACVIYCSKLKVRCASLKLSGLLHIYRVRHKNLYIPI